MAGMSRSIVAVAAMSSPRISPHFEKGLLLVRPRSLQTAPSSDEAGANDGEGSLSLGSSNSRICVPSTERSHSGEGVGQRNRFVQSVRLIRAGEGSRTDVVALRGE